MKLAGSRGLLLKDATEDGELSSEAWVKLPAGQPFQSISSAVQVTIVPTVK